MSVDRVLSRLSVAFITVAFFLVVVAIPLLFSFGPKWEAKHFPVVIAATDEDGLSLPVTFDERSGRTEGGIPYVDFSVQFNKVRRCVFDRELTDPEAIERDPTLGVRSSLSWYGPANERLSLQFPSRDEELPPSRPLGPQRATTWRLYGVSTLLGTRAIVQHRCHPYWLSESVFFPDISGRG